MMYSEDSLLKSVLVTFIILENCLFHQDVHSNKYSCSSLALVMGWTLIKFTLIFLGAAEGNRTFQKTATDYQRGWMGKNSKENSRSHGDHSTFSKFIASELQPLPSHPKGLAVLQTPCLNFLVSSSI